MSETGNLPATNRIFEIPDFPGNDKKREMGLREFLFNPIDSRTPLSDASSTQKTYGTFRRQTGPSEEVKKEWDERIQKMRETEKRTRVLAGRHCIAGVPSVALRAKQFHGKNPYNCLPVEAVADARYLRVEGPIYKPDKLPRLRKLPPLTNRHCSVKRRYASSLY